MNEVIIYIICSLLICWKMSDYIDSAFKQLSSDSRLSFSHKKFPILITDIGGTNSRMRLIQVSSNRIETPVLIDNTKLVSSDYNSLEDLIRTYLEPFKGTDNYPVLATIGLPGAVINNKVSSLANIQHWGGCDGNQIAKNLNITKVHLLNDFVINGYGITGALTLNKDYFKINNATAVSWNSPIAIIGPGTGLGHAVGARSSREEYYEILASEGGHQTFIASTEREWKYRQYLAKKLGKEHISHELGLSGPAIPFMFNYFIDEEQMECKILDMKEEDFDSKRWKLTSEEIVLSANEGDCSVTKAVRKMFVELLASSCSDFCTVTLPLNGLYIVGSISNSFSQFILNDSTFMDRFTNKGRVSGLLKSIPLFLVTDTDIGMKGITEYARQLVEKMIHGS